MKIKLIAPARKPEWGEDFWDISTAVKLRGKKAGGPYLALYILGALAPQDTEVSVVDERVEPISFDEKVDLVGISVVTSLADRAYEIADEYRKRGIPVVMGGIHVSVLPEEAIKHCDSVVIGEAEEIWEQVIEDAKNKNLQKFYRVSKFPDLSHSPVPKWDLLKNDNYTYFTVQIGRGCPYDCEFCLVKEFNGRMYRYRNLEQIIQELKILQSIDPKKLIFFVDDNLLANKKHVETLCEALIPLKIRSWWCQSSLNNLKDDKILELLYKAGCRVIFVGIESISQASIDSMNKSEINKVSEYIDIIEKVHSHGLCIFGSFVLGTDNDDKNIFSNTVKFITDTNIAFAMINILTPPPGSRLFQRLEREGRILHKEWGHYNTDTVCFAPRHMDPELLQSGRSWVLQQIYDYDSLYKRIQALWKRGVLKGRRNIFSKGRIFLSLIAFLSKDFKRTKFILKSLWNRNFGSLASITLSLSFHDYAYRFPKINNLKDK